MPNETTNGVRADTCPYGSIVGSHTKAHLVKVAEDLMFGLNKSVNKAEYVRMFSDIILNHPEVWTPSLSQYEIGLLRKIIELPAGEGIPVYHGYRYMDLFMCSGLFLVKVLGKPAEYEWKLSLSTESLRDCIRRGLDFISEKGERYNRNCAEMDTLAEGFLNCFGQVPLEDLMSFLEKKCMELGGDGSFQDLSRHALCLNPILKNRILYVVDEETQGAERFVWPRMLDDPFFSDDHPEIKPDYGSVSDEELRAMGNRPYIRPVTEKDRKLYSFLTDRLHLDKETADRMYTETWLKTQTFTDPGDVLSWISGNFRFASFLQVQDFIALYAEFNNNVRKWKLKGISSVEFFRKYGKQEF